MKIVVKKTPRYKDAPDDWCIHDLFVNGVHIGTWNQAREKKYLNPEKWAKEQIKKRLVVVQRNIERSTIELDKWKMERQKLTTNEDWKPND